MPIFLFFRIFSASGGGGWGGTNGLRPLTYPDTLARDTGLVLNELAQAMAKDSYGVTLFLQSRRQSIDDDDDDDDGQLTCIRLMMMMMMMMMMVS